MKLVGLLAWYDEPIPLLEQAVRTAFEVGVDELVALDGRFVQFGEGPATSPAEQADVLRDLGVDVVAPLQPWPDEPTKRTALFRLGEQRTDPTDWYLIVDADTEYRRQKLDLRDVLSKTDRLAGYARFLERGETTTWRCLFRALRSIDVGPNHYTYRAADGTLLYGLGADEVDALDASDALEAVHHKDKRPQYRRQAKHDYYRLRDLSGIETGVCNRCGRPAGALMLDGFEVDRSGKTRRPVGMYDAEEETEIVGGYVEACARCAAEFYVKRNLSLAAKLGMDPRWAARPRNVSQEFRSELEALAVEYGLATSGS